MAELMAFVQVQAPLLNGVFVSDEGRGLLTLFLCFSEGSLPRQTALHESLQREAFPQAVCLGAGWHWLCWTWGKLLSVSCERHPCSPPASKTLPGKPSAVPSLSAVENAPSSSKNQCSTHESSPHRWFLGVVNVDALILSNIKGNSVSLKL